MPCDLGAIFFECDIIRVGFGAGRLVAGRPDVTTANIPEVNIRTPVIAGAILSPARDGHPTPSAITGACDTQHHRVAAVGQQMCGNRGSVCRSEPAVAVLSELPH